MRNSCGKIFSPVGGKSSKALVPGCGVESVDLASVFVWIIPGDDTGAGVCSGTAFGIKSDHGDLEIVEVSISCILEPGSLCLKGLT